MPVAEIAFQPVLGSDLSSRLIAWYGQGYGGFSHIDCRLIDGSLVGARSDEIFDPDKDLWIPPGVQIRPPKYEKWVRRGLLRKPCTDDEYQRWAGWILSKRGRQYDKGAILDFISGRRDLHRAGEWICSAFGTESLEKLGWLPRLPIPADQVTPNTFIIAACAVGFTWHEFPAYS